MTSHPQAIAQLIADTGRFAVASDLAKWSRIRTLPYYEGWLHLELFAQFCGDADLDYEALGIDLPATTSRPVSSKSKTGANWYPDLVLRVRETGDLIWVEIKIAALNRDFVKGDLGRSQKMTTFIAACGKAWDALGAIDLDGTADLWCSKDQQQLSAQEVLADFVGARPLVERGHYGVVVALVSSLPEHKVRADVRDGIRERLRPEAVSVRRVTDTDFVVAACGRIGMRTADQSSL